MRSQGYARRTAWSPWSSLVVILLVAGCGQTSEIRADKQGHDQPLTVEDDPDVSAFIIWPPEDVGDGLEAPDENAPEDTAAATEPPVDDVPVLPVGPLTAPEREPVTQPVEPSPPRGPLHGIVIAIDPGHNGRNFDHPEIISQPVDAGGFTKPCNTTGTATQDGFRESTFNLDLALQLREILVERGAEVHLTRTDDDGVGPCIDIRGGFGIAVGADAYLSIHADGAAASARGFHVIRPSGRAGTDLSIVEPSAAFATIVRDHLVAGGFSVANYAGSQGIVARDDLATLNLASVPVLLLEAGNMRNPDEAALLLDDGVRHRMAAALADAIERFTTDPAP